MITPGPRKRRTREHVIADLSRYHVGRWFVAAGHTADPAGADYGYDLAVATFDPNGYVEPGPIFVQLKATDRLPPVDADGCFPFRLDVRDIQLWTAELYPVFVCVFDAGAEVAYWLDVQDYFRVNPTRRPTTSRRTVTVRIPTSNRVDDSFVRHARVCKLERRSAAGHNAEGRTRDA